MTIPEILSANRFDDATSLLRDYYAEPVSNGAPELAAASMGGPAAGTDPTLPTPSQQTTSLLFRSFQSTSRQRRRLSYLKLDRTMYPRFCKRSPRMSPFPR
jgi:hypothetical protein